MARARCRDIPFFYILLSPLLRVFLNSLSISIGIVTATVKLLSPAQTRKASIRTQSGDELSALFSFPTFTSGIEGFLGYTRGKCSWLFAPMTTTQRHRRKQIQDPGFIWLQSCNVWHSKVFNRIGFIAPFALRTVSGLCLFDPFLCLVEEPEVLP